MSALAITYLRQGRSFIKAGDTFKAVELLNKARVLAGENRPLLAEILQELVDAANSAGQVEQALRYREQLVAISDRVAPAPWDRVQRLNAPKKNSWILIAACVAVFFVLFLGATGFGLWWMTSVKNEDFDNHSVAHIIPAPMRPIPPLVATTAPFVPEPVNLTPVAAAAPPPSPVSPVSELGWDRQQLLKDDVGIIIVILRYEGLVEGKATRIDLPFASGTAFAIHAAGFMLTNRHVVDTTSGAERAPATLESQGLPMMTLRSTSYIVCFGPTPKDQFSARVLYKGSDHDVALVKINRKFASPLAFSSLPVRQGDDIVVCGYPGAVMTAMNQADATKDHIKEITQKWRKTRYVDAMELFSPEAFNSTLTRGIVSAAERNVRGVSYVQIDAVISAGNSGGPVLSANNEVIGIATWGIRSGSEGTNSYNFALNIDQVHDELASYLKDDDH